MPVSFWPSTAELIRILPELILTVVATAIMTITPLGPEGPRKGLGHFAIAGLLAALAGAVFANTSPGPAFSGMLTVDGFATFFRVLVIVVGVLTVCLSYRYLEIAGASSGEYYALLLFSIAGQSIMVAANELIMIFIGLEISSIASYVLAGYLRDDKRNNEAAIKYFLLGSFATAFFLYGIAFVYGAAASTNLGLIRAAMMKGQTGPSVPLTAIAAALMFVGLAFKVSGAPFQMWAPDVYQGAPAPVSAFLSAGPKAAAFAIFLRIYLTAFQSIADRWWPLVWISALASMTIGNFAALTQSNVKRLLAYSSIAHAGYVLIALTTRSPSGVSAAMFYLAAYAMMNVGAFAVVTHIAGKDEKHVLIDDLAGLGELQPLTAAALSIFLLSLIGVPLTGGFFGKFYVFKAALEAKLFWLAIFGLLNSAVAAYYYLRIMVVMYMHEPGEAAPTIEPLPAGLRAALFACAAGVLALGIFPSVVLEFVLESAKI